MAGAFVGWQPIVVAFFVSVFPALIFGIAQLIRKGDQALPYGPSLALGILATALGWQLFPPSFRRLFYESLWPGCPLVLFVGVAAVVFLFVAAVILRLIRGGIDPTETAT
jgi:leader peptidase (prepilin peptidase)/N-methyltransferase